MRDTKRRLATVAFLGVLAMAMNVHADPDEQGTIRMIQSDELKVRVDLRTASIVDYERTDNGGRILGSNGAAGGPVVVVSKRGGGRATARWSDLAPAVEAAKDSVVFHCTAKIAGQTAVTFDWAVRVAGHTVTIAAENVKEAGGYDLNEFLIPADPIVRVTSDLPGARVCVGDLLGEKWRGGGGEGGRIVKPGEKLGAQYHFGLVYTDKAAAGVYSNSLYRKGDKPIRPVVTEGSTGLHVNHHRYSYRDENYEPYWCKVGVVADVNGDGVINWKDAACFIHEAIPKRVRLNQDCIKYMLNHGADFEHAADDVLRKICNISDGQKQMALLSGWNGWGWDSEYPTWNQPGEEFGGREGLYKLHAAAHQHRAYTSMIHNFDDAYMHTRGWDPAMISKHEDGSLVGATWWSGGPSYIVGFYRSWKNGKARETIDGLIAQGAEHQIFSDVFTIEPYRADPGPGGSGDEETNLVMGKFRYLEYFAEHDIYMNSEGFNYEMLGRYIGAHNGYNSGLNGDPNRPPLALFICHGLLAKKFFRSNTDEGRFRGSDTEVGTPFDPDNIYRWAMLISFYGDKPMRDFRVVDGGYYARYGDDVEVTWKGAVRSGGGGGRRGGRGAGRGAGGTVTVKLDGKMIADGVSVLLPKPRRGKDMWNVLRAYTSRDAQEMRYPKPAGWIDIDKLTVMQLTFERPPYPVPNAGRVKFDGDELVISIPAGKPYKLVYGPQSLVEAEQKFEPLPPRRKITYPLDEVIAREGGEERPPWIRLRTRRRVNTPEGATLCVGASAVWPGKQQATEHAAAIVGKKIGWWVRQAYVYRSRDYESAIGANTGQLGFDNWYLGFNASMKMFTLDKINARDGVQWYWEKVKAGPDREVGWKAFVCVPITARDGHEVYLQAARDRLAECKAELPNARGARKTQLEKNIQVYEKLLAEDPKKEPRPVRLQV